MATNPDKHFDCLTGVMLSMAVALTALVGATAPALAQPAEPDARAKLVSIMQEADSTRDFDKKSQLYADFEIMLEQILKDEDRSCCEFDSIPNLSLVASSDKRLMIYSWNIPSFEEKAKYGCIIYHNPKSSKAGENKVFRLTDVRHDTKTPDIALIRSPHWYGCIYYDLIEKEIDNMTIYTLIGFDANDNFSHRKYIEVLTFDENGAPIFGLPIFLDDRRGLKTRVIFEYTSQSVVMVRYFPAIDKIVYHYLYPIIPEKAGDASYYVPDVTFDGYEYKFGKWLKVKNVPMIKADNEANRQTNQEK